MQTYDDAAFEIAREIAELIIRKQRQYGQDNILLGFFGPEMTVAGRVHEKLCRLKNLLQTNLDPAEETIEDTWQDIAGLALVALMVRRGKFTLPLKS